MYISPEAVNQHSKFFFMSLLTDENIAAFRIQNWIRRIFIKKLHWKNHENKLKPKIILYGSSFGGIAK
jgi:hypothetical protein